jgi:hypothetical protein
MTIVNFKILLRESIQPFEGRFDLIQNKQLLFLKSNLSASNREPSKQISCKTKFKTLDMDKNIPLLHFITFLEVLLLLGKTKGVAELMTSNDQTVLDILLL